MFLMISRRPVVMCNLNPVWNEELMLSVLQNYKPDKVVSLNAFTYYSLLKTSRFGACILSSCVSEVATRAGSECSVLHYMGRLNAWANPQTLFYK
ncbi:putative C2 domain superfamily protein [Helianthus debilis subsp. tardiflorus]